MGDTVEALGYKADVKGRAKDNLADKRDRLKERITGSSPDSDEVKEGAKRAVGVAQENPLGLAIGSLAVGFVAGMLVPSTRVENEKLGPMADQVKENVKETVQERGGEQAEQLRESTRSKAGQATETGPEPAARR